MQLESGVVQPFQNPIKQAESPPATVLPLARPLYIAPQIHPSRALPLHLSLCNGFVSLLLPPLSEKIPSQKDQQEKTPEKSREKKANPSPRRDRNWPDVAKSFGSLSRFLLGPIWGPWLDSLIFIPPPSVFPFPAKATLFFFPPQLSRKSPAFFPPLLLPLSLSPAPRSLPLLLGRPIFFCTLLLQWFRRPYLVRSSRFSLARARTLASFVFLRPSAFCTSRFT